MRLCGPFELFIYIINAISMGRVRAAVTVGVNLYIFSSLESSHHTVDFYVSVPLPVPPPRPPSLPLHPLKVIKKLDNLFYSFLFFNSCWGRDEKCNKCSRLFIELLWLSFLTSFYFTCSWFSSCVALNIKRKWKERSIVG